MKISNYQKKEFNTFLLGWYQKNGRPSLPWRADQSPYRVLISEIMLQQTQVSRVVEKFTEWMKVFPKIQDVASASQSSVLQTWQGLGYNRRGVYAHKTCISIVDDFKGVVPSDTKKLQTLPGIGPYTAGAICAFAFNQPEVFVETNIRRVVIHHFFKDENNITDKAISNVVAQVVQKKQAKNWYAAMMDYGSTLPKIIKKNPNTKSKTYSKQSRFEGSHRQVRGEVLRQLLGGSPRLIVDLLKISQKMNSQKDLSKGVFKRIIIKMEKENLVKIHTSKVWLVE